MKSALRFSLLTILALNIACASAIADQITITDCNGIPRLVKELTAGGGYSLKLELSDLSSSTEVTLTNLATGEEKVGFATDGVVVVKGMSSGSWKACPSASGLTFTDISLTGGSKSSSITTTSLITAGLLGGGLAIAGSGSGSGSDDSSLVPVVSPASPVKQVSVTSPALPAHEQSNANAETCDVCPKGQGTLNNSDCETGGNPPPLSPIM